MTDTNMELAELIQRHYRGRVTAYAEREREGKDYYTARDTKRADKPLTPDVIAKHLNGGPHVAVYLMDAGGVDVMFATIDLDDHEGKLGWPAVQAKARNIRDELHRRGYFPFVVRSGGGHGIHISLYWDAVQAAGAVRELLLDVLEQCGYAEGAGDIEIFPKQNKVAAGKYGSAVALPFGRESVPLDEDLEPLPKSEALTRLSVAVTSPPVPVAPNEGKKKPNKTQEPGAGDWQRIRSALEYIDADDRGNWRKVGTALHHADPEYGREVWNEWSAKSDKFDERTQEQNWRSFTSEPDGKPVTVASLFKLARDAGWEYEDPIIAELNAKHAVTLVGGKAVVMTEGVDPIFHRPSLELSNPAALKPYYANRSVRVGKKQVDVFTYWLRNPKRRQYQGIVFDPTSSVHKYYNLWRGFAVEPQDGDCSLFLEHVRENIADGDDEVNRYLLAWMADAVQNPAKRPGTSVALRGKQGTGKGVFCSGFGSLFGQHFVHITTPRMLVGNFNAHMKGALIVFADEAVWAGDKAAEGSLKGIVTEDTLAIESKGVDVFFIRNLVRLLISSNHNWLVPAGLEERRFLVLDVGEKRMQDSNYFAAIVEQLDNGGRAALLHHLLNYDLRGVNLRQFPQTRALMEQKLLSMPPLEKFWYGRLMAGALSSTADDWNDGEVPSQELYSAFSDECRRANVASRSVETELGIGLRKLVPWLRRSETRMALKGNPTPQRVKMHVFPPLDECRAKWDEITKTAHEWPGVSVATGDCEGAEHGF